MYAIRPPEYFPPLPFWALMLRTAPFCLDDTFQYSRQSNQNRAKLRNPEGWQWITVPLKGKQHGRAIKDVEIDNSVPWRGKHFRALIFNYRSSPYFEYYEPAFIELYEKEWIYLGDLTMATVHMVCGLLGLPKPEPSSVLNLDTATEMDELLLDSDNPTASGPRLVFEEPSYQQNFEGFEPGMSVLDLLFNYGPQTIGIISDAIVAPLATSKP